MPRVGEHDVFERTYMAALKALLAPYGQFVEYESDRAALDLGLHLYEQPVLDDAQLGQVRVWFQIKGIRASTMSADCLAASEKVAVAGLRVADVLYWFAHPEPVYLVVYLEALDQFLAEDVRDLVDRAGGPAWLRDVAGIHATVTLHVSSSAALREAVDGMPRHRSLRMDGPEFRGRPLGHRLDPLRCELDRLDSEDFAALVARLLDAHDFRARSEIDLAGTLDPEIGSVHAMIGRLYVTYEWTAPIETEFGTGPGSDFRIEAPPHFAHGDVLVVTHDDVRGAPQQTEATSRLLGEVRANGISRALVFFNASDVSEPALIGGWRGTLAPLLDMPQGLGSIAFNVLTATNVYLEFLDRLDWSILNYR